MRKNILKNIILLFLILPLVFQPPLDAKKNPRLPKNYKKWLEEEVVYIITPKEKKAFKQLETDKQRDLFIEEFWHQRDPVENYSLYAILGTAFQELEEYEQAISHYQKFISHEGASFQILNAIGQCFHELGNIGEALRAWEKSLEIKPDQPEIKEKIEAIKKEDM